MLECLFYKVTCPRSTTLLKKKPQPSFVPVNIAKFLRTSYFIEHLWWLLLFEVISNYCLWNILWNIGNFYNSGQTRYLPSINIFRGSIHFCFVIVFVFKFIEAILAVKDSSSTFNSEKNEVPSKLNSILEPMLQLNSGRD